MAISEKIYPRTGDRQTIYLKSVIHDPNISVGEYTMYNDFVNDPTEFNVKKEPDEKEKRRNNKAHGKMGKKH